MPVILMNMPTLLITIKALSCHQTPTSNQPDKPMANNIRLYGSKPPTEVKACATINTKDATHLTYQSLVCVGDNFFKFIFIFHSHYISIVT